MCIYVCVFCTYNYVLEYVKMYDVVVILKFRYKNVILMRLMLEVTIFYLGYVICGVGMYIWFICVFKVG